VDHKKGAAEAFTRQAHATGTWKAVVRDDSGRVLTSTKFDVRG
jgi:hypothetical protein